MADETSNQESAPKENESTLTPDELIDALGRTIDATLTPKLSSLGYIELLLQKDPNNPLLIQLNKDMTEYIRFMQGFRRVIDQKNQPLPILPAVGNSGTIIDIQKFAPDQIYTHIVTDKPDGGTPSGYKPTEPTSEHK